MSGKRGKLITIEGGEGSGKSTQINRLLEAFDAAKLPVIHTREPGGTEGAEAIRNLLVQGDAGRWDPVAETLLFYAARRQHLVQAIWPALENGTHVICDRFSDSSRVYQGCGKELGDDFVMQLHRLSIGTYQPDLTLWLDIDPELGLKRVAERGETTETRFETTQGGFHERVREGFLALTRREPSRFMRIDAGQEIDAVHQAIIRTVCERLGLPVASAVAA